jgi:hypothetical protein
MVRIVRWKHLLGHGGGAVVEAGEILVFGVWTRAGARGS